MKAMQTKTILRVVLAVAAGLAVGLTRMGDDWGSMGMNAVAMVACTLAIGWLLDRHDANLTARMESKGGRWSGKSP